MKDPEEGRMERADERVAGEGEKTFFFKRRV